MVRFIWEKEEAGAFPLGKVISGALGLFAMAYCGVGLVQSYVDLAKRDYVAYTGEFTAEYEGWGRRSRRVITLGDGTKLTDAPIYEDGNGTIVYTRRSKTVIGYEIDG